MKLPWFNRPHAPKPEEREQPSEVDGIREDFRAMKRRADEALAELRRLDRKPPQRQHP